jgi:hypothetical protein
MSSGVKPLPKGLVAGERRAAIARLKNIKDYKTVCPDKWDMYLLFMKNNPYAHQRFQEDLDYYLSGGYETVTQRTIWGMMNAENKKRRYPGVTGKKTNDVLSALTRVFVSNNPSYEKVLGLNDYSKRAAAIASTAVAKLPISK